MKELFVGIVMLISVLLSIPLFYLGINLIALEYNGYFVLWIVGMAVYFVLQEALLDYAKTLARRK